TMGGRREEPDAPVTKVTAVCRGGRCAGCCAAGTRRCAWQRRAGSRGAHAAAVGGRAAPAGPGVVGGARRPGPRDVARDRRDRAGGTRGLRAAPGRCCRRSAAVVPLASGAGGTGGMKVVGFLGNPGSLRRFGMSTETFL